MNKYRLYKIAKQLNLKKSDIDNILNGLINESINPTINADIYKAGTHYGTISIKEII